MSELPISAVIISRNSAATIEACCRSLAAFAEVLVYLNDSSDDTETLCRQFPNVRVERGEFAGFGPTKQAAVDAARCDWVFSIDSDEFADPALVGAMRSIDFAETRRAYQVLRKNRFCGQHVDKGGWGNDLLLRVFHRDSAAFNDRPVHEKVVAAAGVTIEPLDGTLWHDAVTSLDQFLQKISRYSELNAHGVAPSPGQHPLLALARAQFKFFRSYVLQRGFLAGWRGVVIAYAGAVGTFFKYAKRYSKSRGFEADS